MNNNVKSSVTSVGDDVVHKNRVSPGGYPVVFSVNTVEQWDYGVSSGAGAEPSVSEPCGPCIPSR